MNDTGPELRRERLMADIKVTALARKLGKSRQHVHEIERRAVVSPDLARNYRAALLACRT